MEKICRLFKRIWPETGKSLEKNESLIKPYLLFFVVIIGSPTMEDLLVYSIKLEDNTHPDKYDHSTQSGNK